MSNKKVWARSLAGLLLLGFLIGAFIQNQSIKTRAKVNEPVPEWTLEDFSGNTVSLSDFRGQPVLLNLWTTWCVSCKEEMPALQAFHERYGDKIKVLGIDVKEPKPTVKEFIDYFGVTYPIIMDKQGYTYGRYNVRGYPESWFLDKDGIARVKWDGPLSFEQMRDFYQRASGQSIDTGPVGAVAAESHLHAVALDAGAVYVGSHNGLFKSTDDGKTWQAVSREMGLDREDSMGVVLPAAASGGTLYVSGHNLGVLVSRDGGRSWRDVSQGLPARDVHALAADAEDRLLYAWVVGAGLYVSEGGSAWRSVESGLDPGLPVTALAVNPGDPRQVILAAAQEGPTGWEGRLWISGEGGRNWRQVDLRDEVRGLPWLPVVFGIVHDPIDPRVVYYATNKGIWKSEDGGRSAKWLRRSHARLMTAVAARSGPDGTTALAAGAPNGDVYLSKDGGTTWTLLTH